MAAEPKRKLHPVAWLYILTVICLGGLTMLWLTPDVHGDLWLEVVCFAFLIFAAEALPVPLPRGGGSVSVGYAIIYASIVTFGPGIATWLAALATLRVRELTLQVSIEKVLFNRAQLALSAAAAGLAYVALGGSVHGLNVLQSPAALLAAAAVYSLVNITTVVLALAVTRKASVWNIWLTNFRWLIPHYLALTPLGILIAAVHAQIGMVGVVFLFLPLFIARYSLQLYADLRKAYLATIQAMVVAMEARDPHTAGHSRRVARYTVATARALRLTEDHIERLEYAAWLHDIGKLAVPDHILQKKASLSAAEWQQMKRHPEIGASIAKQIKTLGPDLEIILHHHERWDGTGYPDLLKETEIPLGARIIAIADAYEAMTSARPYRVRKMTQEQAFAELRRGAGTQFDPDLVEVFIRTVLSLAPDDVLDAVAGAPFRAAPLETEAACREAAAAAEPASPASRSDPSGQPPGPGKEGRS